MLEKGNAKSLQPKKKKDLNMKNLGNFKHEFTFYKSLDVLFSSL
tara:strand:- start:338 stop:469 length:132 start_codon:yes stop_codon:yes gene_type:complete